MSGSTTFDRVRAIADAVLLEGYVLYPYRASAPKNRYRWTFGVLAPRAWSEAGGCEPWWMETECLVEPPADGVAPALEGRLRFLHPHRRAVEVREGRPDDASSDASSGGDFRPVESTEIDGRLLVSWEEGDLLEIPFALPLRTGAREDVPFSTDPESARELLRDGASGREARITRARDGLTGAIRIAVEDAHAERPLLRLRIRVENLTAFAALDAPRDLALRASSIASHLLLSVRDGAFVSLLDPPDWASAAAGACRNRRCWPVLAGAPGTRDLVLSAPIVLYDHPQLAPESAGDYFDATEIDELLTLRTRTMTPEEKRHARATDPRAAAVIDRADALPPEMMERMHGAIRDLQDAEMRPRTPAPPAEAATRPAVWTPGTRVRLKPGRRRTDAQDILYAGCIATVRRVMHDVDGRDFLAVTLDDDPNADLQDQLGRHFHYDTDEVEVVTDADGVEEATS